LRVELSQITIINNISNFFPCFKDGIPYEIPKFALPFNVYRKSISASLYYI
jgi:hypothetical protein